MKLSLTTSHLLEQLQITSRIASTRSANETLAGVLISAEEGQPTALLASDAEIGLRLPVDAEVLHPGVAVLPARLFADVVRALPAPQTTLELRPSQADVELISGSAVFHLRTLRAEDFPHLPQGGDDTRVVVPAGAFVETIARVARSASRDETRPVLTGIMILASQDRLQMVATDSYRLSVKETRIDPPVEGALEANIPARALQELARIAQQSTAQELSVSVGQRQVVFELGDTVLSSRLIDGQFPNFRQLLPQTVEHELRLATAEITDVVRRVGLLAQRTTPLRLALSAGELTVSARTPDIGEAAETIPVDFQGETFEIGFNPDFLREGLESVDTEELVLKLISPLRPGLIQSPDSDDFIYLIMPIRLNP